MASDAVPARSRSLSEMVERPETEITRMLQDLERGAPGRAQDLLPLVYD
jgi:hypothetical protein